MKSCSLYILLLFLLHTGVARSQVNQEDRPQVLGELFNRLVDNYNDNDRIRINDSIRLIIDDYVHSADIFTDRFTNLRFLGQILSPDSLVKIITWNLVLENQPGSYFCYLIRKTPTGKENQIFKLTAKYDLKNVFSDTTYSQSDWYGALYYDIRPFVKGDDHSYVVLGIDYGNPDITRKVIDVLNFENEGSLGFGRKCFISGEELKYRAVFGYASNAMMSLRFKTDSTIVFDHLVPFSEGHKDDRKFYAPDFSFDSFIRENDMWKLKINVDARNQ
jgi:hypothetical protein